ncbi:MAG: DUF4062 domain-containing protein [Actinomycetota bacterium]
MPAKKKLQVFVSSTYLDLKSERQAAVEAILKAGHIPAGMELFSAGNDSQLDTIRRWIDESDVYMLILGGRYGSVDPKTSLSYIELEYDYAVSKDKPVFPVMITEAALDQKLKVDGKSAIETERPKELKLFREKVLGRISSFFGDSRDIKLAVHETISDFVGRYEFTGWVSGDEVADSSSLIEEISRLHKHNVALEKELAELKKNAEKAAPKVKSRWGDDEFEEAIDLLKHVEIKTQVFDESKPAITVSVFYLLHALRDTLITGVTNQFKASALHTLLYFNVCPKLEVHGLAALEKVPAVAWQRYRLTPKGMSLLAFIDKKDLFAEPKTVKPAEASV